MMLRLVRYELENLRQDRRAMWALLSLAVLVLLTFAAIGIAAARGDADKRAVAAAERERWVTQGEKDPHAAAHYAFYVFKPSPPLAALDSGVEPFMGQGVWLEAHHQNDMLYRPQQGVSLLQRAGLADPASLILAWAPLIVILIAFAIVARDRERGTMRLALAAASTPARYVRVKTIAVWAVCVLCLAVPVSIAGLLWLAVAGRLEADALLRLLLWSLLMSAYLALFAAMAVCAMLRARDGRMALAFLTGLWILLALVLPRAADNAVARLEPLPTTQSVRQRIAEETPFFAGAEQAQARSSEQARRNRAELLQKHGVEKIDDILNPRMAELDLIERGSHATFDRVLGDFYDRVVGQDRLFAGFGFLSPTIAAQSLSAAVAGTDFSHHRDFIDTAEQYRRDMVNMLNADGMAHRARGEERHVNDVQLWSQVSEFDYRAPPLRQNLGIVMPAVAAMALWLAAAWILLALAARRLKP